MWDEGPYWYLWFTELGGVFKLALRRVTACDGAEWTAEFGVKYYPRPDEAYFSDLSVLEQVCRRSEVFSTVPSAAECCCPCHAAGHGDGDRFSDLGDSTGVPAIPHADCLPEDFFFAGKITLNRKQTGLEVGFESQDRWRIVMAKDFYLCNENGDEYKVLRQGETDRDFPGFALTSFLYRKVVSGLEALYGCRAVMKDELATDGLVFYSDGSKLWHSTSKDIKRISAQSEMVF